MKSTHHLLLTAALAGALAGPAQAQDVFPSKPVKIIVPSTPGAQLDFTARIVSNSLARRLGQPVIVDNKPGAAGALGTSLMIKSAPDGYTLGTMSTAHTSMHLFVKNLAFDVLKDMAPVSEVMRGALVLLGSPKAAARTLPELMAYGKANQGKLNYATTGTADPLLGFLLLSQITGVKMAHFPYPGGAQVIQAVVAGDVDMGFTNTLSGAEFVKGNRAIGLAVTGTERYDQLPAVPTLEELGYKGFTDMPSFGGIAAPAGTPRDIIERLSREIAAVVKEPEVVSAIHKLGQVPVGSTPEQYRAVLATSIEKWTRLAREVDLRPQ